MYQACHVLKYNKVILVYLNRHDALLYKKCFCRCVVVEFQLIYCVLNETALVKIVS